MRDYFNRYALMFKSDYILKTKEDILIKNKKHRQILSIVKIINTVSYLQFQLEYNRIMNENKNRDKTEEGFLCKRCGNRYKGDYNVSDRFILDIKYKEHEIGSICGRCIIDSLETLGFFNYEIK